MQAGDLPGYIAAYGCGVVSAVIVWQVVSLRREVAEFRAEQIRDAKWDAEHLSG